LATGRDRQLTGAVGEFRVAAELCRRGFLATPFSGNVPHYDIIASGQQGGHLAVQVKAINSGSYQFDIRRFMEVELKETSKGKKQIPGKLNTSPYPGLIYVFVLLGSDGVDRFFVLTWKQLCRVIVAHYNEYLEKHGGIRPKAPESFHVSLSVGEIESFENMWETIEETIR